MGRQEGDSFKEACSNRTGPHCRLPGRDRIIPQPADFGTSDPQACLNACLGQLFRGDDIGDYCQQLQIQKDDPKLLRSLYCCDYTNCGVWIDKPGQSPNVDLIINRCQNNGYYSIPDPGPPAWDSCPSVAPSNSQPVLPSGTTGPPDTELRTLSGSSVATMTSVPTRLSSTSEPMPASPTPSSGTLQSISNPSESAPTGLTAGSKAAIGVCASLGIIALIFLLVFLFRRRRSFPRNYLKSSPVVPRHIRSFSEPPSGSRTSLIAPLMTPVTSASSRTAPCTPPARLSDRKYIGSCFNQDAPHSRSSPRGRRTADDPGLPVSPVFAPPQSHHSTTTNSKLAPRHSRRATTSSIRFPLPASPPPHCAQSSMYSLPGASTTTFGSNPNRGPPAPAPLRLPSGPPPTRALPPPPPPGASPTSPTFPRSPTTYHHRYSPGVGAAARELCDLTEAYAREARGGSWGSWSGGVGGGPGGRKRGSDGTSSRGSGGGKGSSAGMALRELDLEKLGGRY
ncbi:hypothetical protein F4810DRAFT_620165 [Camillea tinctor]|nr:hypothetical protein F4810DRAFT_620165 [Camillea tinctor]